MYNKPAGGVVLANVHVTGDVATVVAWQFRKKGDDLAVFELPEYYLVFHVPVPFINSGLSWMLPITSTLESDNAHIETPENTPFSYSITYVT